MKTKDKILHHGKILFNKNGFGATTLHQIAQTIGISRGNLTYYFKTKTAFLEVIVEEMGEKYKAKMVETQYPAWENTYNATKAFHELQQAYSFIFFDKQVMAYPAVQKQIKRIYEDDLKRQMAIITFSVQIGNMRAELIPGTYYNLCRTLWMLSFFWLMSDIYQDIRKESSWDKIAWSLILPHFTPKGVAAFVEHFGEAYYQSLGKAYDNYITQTITF